jgi:hypothetical protein
MKLYIAVFRHLLVHPELKEPFGVNLVEAFSPHIAWNFIESIIRQILVTVCRHPSNKHYFDNYLIFCSLVNQPSG